MRKASSTTTVKLEKTHDKMGQKEWVLIRGMMSESYHWWHFLPALQKTFPGHEFHTPNILGNGPTGTLKTPLSISRNIEALREQIPSKNQKKIIVGFSLGGMMALEWAYAHPHEVEALVLINCSSKSSIFYKRLRPRAVAEIFHFSAFARGERREALTISLTTGLEKRTCQQLAIPWTERARQYPVRASNFFAQIALAHQVELRPSPPSVPILLLASERDRVVHPDCSRKIANVWNLPLDVHPSAGHDIAVSDPDWLLHKLQSWGHLKTPVGAENVANASLIDSFET